MNQAERDEQQSLRLYRLKAVGTLVVLYVRLLMAFVRISLEYGRISRVDGLCGTQKDSWTNFDFLNRCCMR